MQSQHFPWKIEPMHYPRKYSHTLRGGRFKKDMFAHFPKIVFFSIVIVINCNQIDTSNATVCQNGKVLGILSFQSLIFSFKFVKNGLHLWLPHNLEETVFFCIICIIQCKHSQFSIVNLKFSLSSLQKLASVVGLLIVRFHLEGASATQMQM